MGNTTSANEKEIIDITNCEYERLPSGKRHPKAVDTQQSTSAFKKSRPNNYLADHRPSLSQQDDFEDLNLSSEMIEELRSSKTPAVIAWLKYAVKTGNFRKAFTELSPQLTPLAFQNRHELKMRPPIETIDLTREDSSESVEIIGESFQNGVSEPIVNGVEIDSIENIDDSEEGHEDDVEVLETIPGSNEEKARSSGSAETPKSRLKMTLALKPSRWQRNTTGANPWTQMETSTRTSAPADRCNYLDSVEYAVRSYTPSLGPSDMLHSGVNLAERDRFEKMVRLTQSPAIFSHHSYSAVSTPVSPSAYDRLRRTDASHPSTPVIDDENGHAPSTSTATNNVDYLKILEQNRQTRDEVREETERVHDLIKDFEKSSLSSRSARQALEHEIQLRQERNERERKDRQAKRDEELRNFIVGRGQLIEPEKDIDYDFIDLDSTQLSLVNDAWDKAKPLNEELIKAFGLEIKRSDLQKLRGLEWLNDEVINFFLEMVADRPNRPCSRRRNPLPKVHAFNTFFYGNLAPKYQYQRVKRWTRKIDIFSYDMLLVPVHLGMHWCMAIVDMRQRIIRYFDSLGGDNTEGMQAVLQYLCDESEDKRKKPLDRENWAIRVEKDIPMQLNGSDCGVFSCKFADFVSRDKFYDFSQENMPYFRRRMVVEIMQKHLIAQY